MGKFQPRGSRPLQLDSRVSIEGLVGSRRNIETHRISVIKAAGICEGLEVVTELFHCFMMEDMLLSY